MITPESLNINKPFIFFNVAKKNRREKRKKIRTKLPHIYIDKHG